MLGCGLILCRRPPLISVPLRLSGKPNRPIKPPPWLEQRLCVSRDGQEQAAAFMTVAAENNRSKDADCEGQAEAAGDMAIAIN